MTAINSNRAIRGPVTAVPVVAGKGVRLVADTENNRWVVEADETVLFNDSDPQPIITATDLSLSETVRNFERVKVYYKDYYGPDAPSGRLHMCSEGVVAPETFGLGIPGMPTGDSTTVFFDLNSIMFDSTKPTKVTVVSGTKRVGLTINGSSATFNTTTSRGIFLYKVVGINRIASN